MTFFRVKIKSLAPGEQRRLVIQNWKLGQFFQSEGNGFLIRSIVYRVKNVKDGMLAKLIAGFPKYL